MHHPLISNKDFSYQFVKQNKVLTITNSDLKLKTTKFINQINKVQSTNNVLLSLLDNGPRWNYIDHACLLSGWIHTPLNKSLSSNELQTIIATIKPDIIVCKKKRHLRLAREFAKSNQSKIINIDDEVKWKEETLKNQPVNTNNTAVILYTSGSTNLMKGIKHSHASLINAIDTFSEQISPLYAKRALSYLPLSFSGERKLNYTYQRLGIDICYASTAKSLLDNVLLFKPDIMALVPSLLEKLITELESIKEKCSLKYIICGGASIAPNVKTRYLELDIKVIEVYGLTETASIGTINLSDNFSKINSVGKSLPNADIKISSENEVLIHSKSLMQSYLNQPIDWVYIDERKYIKTGDSGYLDEDDFLYITGRINDHIKLQNGTWLMPQEAEKKLLQLSNNQFDYAVIIMNNSKLTAIIITELETKLVQRTIDKFNNNGFIYIDEIIIKDKSILDNDCSNLKFSRKNLITKVFN